LGNSLLADEAAVSALFPTGAVLTEAFVSSTGVVIVFVVVGNGYGSRC
jgi:hypothetical protein